MSKVNLTQDHKIKLIQMTEFIMYDYDVGINDYNEVHYQHKQNPEKQGEIYWLEHVIYHLAKKILNRDDSAILQFHVSCLTIIFSENSPCHPINYLHERYMRNKIAKEKQFKLDL
jgi:hypothetical protein